MEQAEPNTPTTKPQAKTFEQVRQHMNELFSLEEIRVLVFDLDIDYDNLVGETKNGKIISLLIDLAQHQRPPELETKLNKIRPQIDWQFALAKFPVSQQPLDQNRKNFLNIMQNTWINGFLYQSLHSEVIKLTMTAANGEMLAQGAWRRSWQMVKQQQNMADELIPLDKSVGEVFEESGQGLLILGDPGSGKTITMLQLAEDLLADAKLSGQPMPVVLNLSSWAQEKLALADWLVAEIFVQYGVSRGLAKQWVESNSLIYLLDGLDEVTEEARDACITAINQFREDKPGEPGLVPMVVCSRMADYEVLNERLNLNTAIQIQPLSREQVNAYLQQPNLEMQVVQEMRQHDQTLRKLTRSPLLLNVMTLAYQGKTVDELQTLDSVEARRQHLFDAYIDAMFAHRPLPPDCAYSEAEARHWLMETAQGLTLHNVSEFYIEKLQPYWLPEGKPRRRYAILYGLIVGLIVGLMFGFIGWLISGPILGLIWGLIWGPISGPILGPIVGLIVGPIVGLSVGLIGGLSIGLSVGLSKDREQINSVEELRWRPSLLRELLKEDKRRLIGLLIVGLGVGWISGVIVESIVGLSVGLSVRLSVGLVAVGLYVLDAGFSVDETREKSEPNQGIRSSRDNALRMGLLYGLSSGLIGGLIFWLIFWLIGGLIFWLIFWLIVGLIGGLIVGLMFGILKYGGDAVIKHYTLRWVMARHHILPYPLRDKKLIAFLDAMAERILLRRVGNGYIFIHRSLMEHFAAKHPPSKDEG